MKKHEIEFGGRYLAKVGGRLVNLRYDVTNLATGRKLTFRSSARFRALVAGAEMINRIKAALANLAE